MKRKLKSIGIVALALFWIASVSITAMGLEESLSDTRNPDLSNPMAYTLIFGVVTVAIVIAAVVTSKTKLES